MRDSGSEVWPLSASPHTEHPHTDTQNTAMVRKQSLLAAPTAAPLAAACLLLLCAQCVPTAAAAATASYSAASHAHILADVDAIRHAIHRFWQEHGPDYEYGGFHGTLSLTGDVVHPTAKGLVQQTRHIWAFSTYELLGYRWSAAERANDTAGDSSSEDGGHGSSSSSRYSGSRHSRRGYSSKHGRPDSAAPHAPPLSSAEMARSAYDFVSRHMRDDKSGLFSWNATREGEVVEVAKVIYGQWFVLYSLSQFYTVFGDEEARELAHECFRAMDAAWHSAKFGGFMEIASNNFPPIPVLTEARVLTAAAQKQPGDASSPVWEEEEASTTAAATASTHKHRKPTHVKRQSEPASTVRTLNVAMHGLEALTALHKITHDPVVLARVHEYLEIICTKLTRVRGLISEEYEAAAGDEPWQPAPGAVVNYGHNLESTWLVAVTLDYLLELDAIPADVARRYRATVMSIGAAAIRDGYDAQHGGVHESGSALEGPTGPGSSLVKVWWIQAEAMLALWKLHEYFNIDAAPAASNDDDGSADGDSAGEVVDYLQVLAHTVRFVRDHQTDGAGSGEQFWQVEADGTWVPTGDGDKDTKGNRWKASYHSSRGVLFLEQWMREAQLQAA